MSIHDNPNFLDPTGMDKIYRAEKERQIVQRRIVDEVQGTEPFDLKEELGRLNPSTFIIVIAIILATLLLAFSVSPSQAQSELMIEQPETGLSDMSYFATGFNLMHYGEFEAAIEWLDRAVDVHPEHASAYAFRATAYYELGEYDLALIDYNIAIQLSPAYESAYRWRADTHDALGNTELAELDREIAALLTAKVMG